jgi:predicted membrane-bound spermidine synthase
VEVKIHLQPDDNIFTLLETKIDSITCVHLFDTVPQEKVAVSYKAYTADMDEICLTVVSSVIHGKVIKYLYSENIITSITCPDEHLVICGTDQGSIIIYNLNDHNKSTLKDVNYRNLL